MKKKNEVIVNNISNNLFLDSTSEPSSLILGGSYDTFEPRDITVTYDPNTFEATYITDYQVGINQIFITSTQALRYDWGDLYFEDTVIKRRKDKIKEFYGEI